MTGTFSTAACNAIANCAGTPTCTTSTDAVCPVCAAGYFKNGAGTCSTCPAGASCPAGSTQPLVCSAGTWSAAGASSCATCTSACAAGFFESTACTPTSNRVCSAINCAPGQYWSGGACTACVSGFTSAGGYVTSCILDVNECATNNGGCGGGSTAAATCTNTYGGYRCDCNPGFTGNGLSCTAVNCAAGQYWNGLSCTACSTGYTSAGGYVTACTDVNECLTNNGGCGGGSAMVATCTNTSGGSTCGCNSGYYGSGTSCAAWSTCAAGSYVAATGTASTDRVCVACGAGTYSSTTNAASCAPFQSCAAGAGYTAGSSTANSVCTVCTGATWSAGGIMPCTAWQTCNTGTYVANTPTATADRVCTACAAGYASVAQNASSCTDVTAPPSPDFAGILGAATGITVEWYGVWESGSGLANYLVTSKPGVLPPPAGCAGGVYTTQTRYTVSSLVSGSTYTFRVCSVDASGNVSAGSVVTGATQNCAAISHCSGGSTCASGTALCPACDAGFTGSGTATCADVAAPSNVASLSATAEYTGLALSWSPVSDTAGSGLRGYRVAFAAGSTPPAACANTDVLVTDDTAYRLSGLVNGANYAVRVCAEDRAGNRASGTTAVLSTLSCTPIAGCAGTVTCTTATDSVCSSCSAGSAKDTNTSSATYGRCVTCAAGTYAAAGSTQCTACATGSWSAAGAGSCSAWSTCAAGSYVSNMPTATTDRTCEACATGTFSTTTNATSCGNWSTCAAGSYVSNTPSASSDRTCSACAAGTYASSTNAASCSPWSTCAAGTYVSNAPTATTNRICSSCTAGVNYSTTTNASSCTAVTVTGCTAGNGFTAPTPMSNGVCTACSGSTYSTGGTMACTTRSTLSCAAGQGYTAGTASTNNSCAACTGSTYSTGGTMACTAWQTCSAGFGYAAGSASANATCTACTGTNYSTGGTMACTAWSQTSCLSGFGYAAGSASTNSTCTACNSSANATAGKYSTGGTMACTAWQTCAPGTGYTAGTASTNSTCTVCSTGRYSTGGTMACTSCPAGTANGSTGQTSCTACPQYTYSPAAGATSCRDCMVGTYNTGTGNSACGLTDATSPFFPDSITASAAPGAGNLRVSWTTGTDTGGSGVKGYCISTSNVNTTTMPADIVCASPNVPASACSGTACTYIVTGLQPGGAYRLRVYIIDNAGRFGKNDNGLTLYNAGCSAGSAPNFTSPGACSACTGSNWSDGSSFCRAWTTCVAGNYTTNTPSATTDRTCAMCGVGSYTSSANQQSCAAWTVTSCPAGYGFTAGTSTANGSCTACVSGITYSTGGTMACTACATCTAGTSYEVQACTATDNRVCAACASCDLTSGYYWSAVCGPGPAAGVCTLDATKPLDGRLTYSSGYLSGVLTWTAATDVGTGTSMYRYVKVLSSKAPVDCSVYDGTTTNLSYTYTSLSSKSYYSYRVCAVDGAGNVSPGASLNNVLQSTASVTSCSAGYAPTDTGCSPCTSGTWSGGATACVAWKDCAAGTYVATSPTTSNDRVCSPCAAGMFSSTTNAGVCSACSTGTFSLGGSASCTTWSSCSPGTYVSVTGTSTRDRSCSQCPVGTYVDVSNSVSCTSCPSGYVAGIGAAGCSLWTATDSCPVGYGYSVTSSPPCTACIGAPSSLTGGTYSVGGTMACTACTSFSSGYTQTQSCDATRNRVAVDQTAPADTAMNLSGATGTTTGTIILSWSAGTDSGGSGVSDYRIAKLLGSKYPTSSGCTTSGSYISTGSSLTGYTYSGLSSGSIYTFRVCAVDAAGNVGSGSNSRSDVKAR